MSASTARNKHSKSHGNEKVDITKDEFDRIREALQNEEFRKLFFDYVEEVQDPENCKRYEEEIKQLEKERGVECIFIHPTPGFVIKTAIDGELKCFINIASSKEVERPNNQVSMNSETGERGLNWSIPMAQTPPRADIDAQKNECKVYDVVFHPDALHLGKRDQRFRQCLIDTALDSVEREYQVKLDRANLKFPKLDYKGSARPTVIRKLAKNATDEEREPHPLEHMYPKKPDANGGKPKVLPMKTKPTPVPKFTVPRYSIKHSHDLDMSEYTDELDAKLNVTVPRALILEIDLPLLSSTADCQLDVTDKSVYLLSERHGAKYRLKLDLPYIVDDKAGNARFDIEHRQLRITLPVVRSNAREQREMHDTVRLLSREDSGVELHSSSESPAEEDEPELLLGSDAIVELTEQSSTEQSSDAFPPTANVTASPRSFLKSNLHYQLPAKFDCNILDNVMAFVLHVRNVQPDSVETLQQARSLHLQFASMGSGYYPTHYALLIKLPEDFQPELHIEHVETDASDNNVVLRLCMTQRCEMLPSYLAGLDSNDLNSYTVFGNHNNSLDDDVADEEALKETAESLHVEIERNEVEQTVEVTIMPEKQNLEKADEDLQAQPQKQLQEQQPQQQKQQLQEQHLQHKKLNKLPSYLAGLDSNDLNSYTVFGNHNNSLDDDVADEEALKESAESLHIEIERNKVEQTVEVTIRPWKDLKKVGQRFWKNLEEQPQEQLQEQQPQQQKQQLQEQHLQHKKLNKKQRKRNKRSLSESACEDIKAAHEEQQQHKQQQKAQVAVTQPMATLMLPPRKQRSYSECNESSVGSSSCIQRGILKRFTRYGPRPSISDSCSSIDDCSSSYSCSVDAAAAGFSQSFGGIPEERAGGDDASMGLSESCKKTVRFNEQITKQVFRPDSSILGQRKKNQKRRDCKMRAQNRRVSEGDSADYEEADQADNNGGQHKTAANSQYFKPANNRHGKDNKRHSLHDSGLDLTNNNLNHNNNHNEDETKRNEADAKNSMIFEMDDDDDM